MQKCRAEFWICLEARGDQIVVDVSALVDRPERHQQEQQTQNMQHRQRRQCYRTQHPEREIFLQDAADDISRAGALDMCQVLTGQVDTAQGVTIVCLRPHGSQRTRARIEQREVLRRIGKHERAANGVVTERADGQMKFSIAAVGEGRQSRGHYLRLRQTESRNQRRDDRLESGGGDDRRCARSPERRHQTQVGEVFRQPGDPVFPATSGPGKAYRYEAHAPHVARRFAAGPAPRLDDIQHPHQQQRRQTRTRRVDEVLGGVAQIQRFIQIEQDRSAVTRIAPMAVSGDTSCGVATAAHFTGVTAS